MSTQRKKRAEKREAQEHPQNFTCGVCGQVHEYNEGYTCPNSEEAKEEEKD